MNYQTVYEKRLRTVLCILLWCSPYSLMVLAGVNSLREAVPFLYENFLYILIAAMLLSWVLIVVIQICSRQKKCFSKLRTKQLLKQCTPQPAAIVRYQRIPHSTARPGKWIECIPIVEVNGSEMMGNAFVDTAPPIGSECEVVLYQNKCWVIPKI